MFGFSCVKFCLISNLAHFEVLKSLVYNIKYIKYYLLQGGFIMGAVRVISDSTCDLSQELIKNMILQLCCFMLFLMRNHTGME